jgi:TonB family protein
MTASFPQRRLGGALAASLGVHAALAAALAGLAAGWQPGSDNKPALLLASLQAAPSAPAPSRPASAPARPERGSHEAAAAGVPLPQPEPYYYRTSELTERPAPLARVQPRFPDGAPESGRLKMRLYINETGTVDAIDITEAEPEGVFEQAAAEAFAAARFRPGHKDGNPVKSQISLEVSFGAPLALPTPRRPL